MEHLPAEYLNTAYSAQGKGLVVPTTPIEVTIETADISLTVRGSDGQQVHDTLYTTFKNLRKPRISTSDDALLFGVVIAVVVGFFIIACSAFYSLGQRNTPSTSITKSS